MDKRLECGAKVINFCDYRRRKRRAYLIKNESKLNTFLSDFLRQNFKTDFERVHSLYISQQIEQNETIWDLSELREAIVEAINTIYGRSIWEDVLKQNWFNAQYISQAEIVDHCASRFIMSRDQIAY